MLARFISLAAVAALLSSASAYAADPTDKCHSGKLKESAKYASCRLKAESKAILKATTPDFSKCTAKFPAKFNDIESKAGTGVCPTEGDGANIEARITSHAGDIAVLLAGGGAAACGQFPATGQTISYGAGDDGDLEPGAALQYTDNGDGTVTDESTGLIWEKKIALDENGGAVTCTDETGSCANPHHADNRYFWTSGTTAYDGDVVTIFLQQLNNRCDQDTTLSCTVDADCAVPGGTCGFAGHQDWRLPTIKELQSIVNYSIPYPGPTVTAFFGGNCGSECTDITDPACSCMALYGHWSSTTNANDPTNAWFVNFSNALTGYGAKTTPWYARAVRGGS